MVFSESVNSLKTKAAIATEKFFEAAEKAVCEFFEVSGSRAPTFFLFSVCKLLSETKKNEC